MISWSVIILEFEKPMGHAALDMLDQLGAAVIDIDGADAPRVVSGRRSRNNGISRRMRNIQSPILHDIRGGGIIPKEPLLIPGKGNLVELAIKVCKLAGTMG